MRPSKAVCTALRSLSSSIDTIWSHGSSNSSCVCLFHTLGSGSGSGNGSTGAVGRAKAQQHPQQQRSTSSSGGGGEDAALPIDAVIITRGSGVTDAGSSSHQTQHEQQRHVMEALLLDALLFGKSGSSSSSSPNTSSSSSNGPNASTSTSSGASPSSSSSSSSSTVAGDAYRRGFGAKVALPPADLLHEPLVEQPATIRLRAYQIGSRVHIGRVLALAQMEGCRTSSGKDYCIIWLQPHKQQQQRLDSQDDSSGSGSQPGSSQGSDSDRSRSTGRFVPRLQKGIQSHSPLLWAQWQQLQGVFLTKLQQGQQQQGQQQQGQQQQQLQQQEAWHRHQQQQPAEQLPDAPAHWLARDDPTRDWSEVAEEAAHQRQQQWQQHWQQHWQQMSSFDIALLRPGGTQPMMPPLLVVYRYGSVVLAGTRLADEPGLVLRHVPPEVCYRAGGDSTWALREPPLQVGQPAETLAVVVQPELTQPAEKGTDQVLLKVLDVGSVRVLTSVLAQSAALSFYESSVQKSLEHLADWRARHRRRSSAPGSLLQQWLAAAASRQHDAVMFKVIAASALVIAEARELLEMAEPAWAYDAYHSLWRLAQKDFELEQRLASLETKLALVEQEAKHDVKDRTGRRYRRAEQGVVWLLLVSAAIAAYEVWLKAQGADGGSSRRKAGRSAGREEGASGAGAAAAAGPGGIESWLDSYARVAAEDGAEDELLLAEQQLGIAQQQQQQVDEGPPNDSDMCEHQHRSNSSSSRGGGRRWGWWPRSSRRQQQQHGEAAAAAGGDIG